MCIWNLLHTRVLSGTGRIMLGGGLSVHSTASNWWTYHTVGQEVCRLHVDLPEVALLTACSVPLWGCRQNIQVGRRGVSGVLFTSHWFTIKSKRLRIPNSVYVTHLASGTTVQQVRSQASCVDRYAMSGIRKIQKPTHLRCSDAMAGLHLVCRFKIFSESIQMI